VTDQPWLHPKIVCKFCGDPLRDGRDPLSTKSGPKQRKIKGTAAEQIAALPDMRGGRLESPVFKLKLKHDTVNSSFQSAYNYSYNEDVVRNLTQIYLEI